MRAIGIPKQRGTTPWREQRKESRELGKMGDRPEAAFRLHIDACLREKKTELGLLCTGEGQVLLSFFFSLFSAPRIVPLKKG
jgi:hypothetical protein